jgi:hypothetical protein
MSDPEEKVDNAVKAESGEDASPPTEVSPPTEDAKSDPPSPLTEEVEAEAAETKSDDPPQGGDPPAEDPPATQSIHATGEYPETDSGEDEMIEEEVLEEEVVDEEIFTDGEETIEEEIVEEEVTDDEKGGDTSEEAAPTAEEAPTMDEEGSAADVVTSPMRAKKDPVLDSDLASFMERRRKMADGEEGEDASTPTGPMPPPLMDDDKTQAVSNVQQNDGVVRKMGRFGLPRNGIAKLIHLFYYILFSVGSPCTRSCRRRGRFSAPACLVPTLHIPSVLSPKSCPQCTFSSAY